MLVGSKTDRPIVRFAHEQRVLDSWYGNVKYRYPK